MEVQPEPLRGGALLAAISEEIVRLMREHYGRGPTRAKTYVMDDVVVVLLRNGFTAMEKTMMAGGRAEGVVVMRHDFQTMMAAQYKAVIERLTGSKVTAFLSQAHVEPDITLEVFILETGVPGFGVAAEMVPGDV